MMMRMFDTEEWLDTLRFMLIEALAKGDTHLADRLEAQIAAILLGK